MYEKNEEYVLTIGGLGTDGMGIGRLGRLAVFVEGALPGETVSARLVKLGKDCAYGKLLNVIRPSAERVAPACPVYKRCGGCTLQHMSYGQELIFKREKLENCLRKIGGFKDFKAPDAVGCHPPYFYRNKAQFPFGLRGGRAVLGFFSPRSHVHVPVTACRIQHPVMEAALDAVQDFANEYRVPVYNEQTHSGILRHIMVRVGFNSGEVMVCVVVKGAAPPFSDILSKVLPERLKEIEGLKSVCLNFNGQRTNVVLGEHTETLWGAPYIVDTLGGLRFRISPHSFYQVNPVQTEKLYAGAIEAARIKPGETVLDMYCGIGAISLFAAKRAGRVIGVEIAPQAVDDARINARINGVTNAEFICEDAEKALPRLYCCAQRPAAVILDPPRKGCAPGLIRALLNAPPPKLVYISCDPATLARDLKPLCEGAYDLESARPFDCFPRTAHVETIASLRRRDT